MKTVDEVLIKHVKEQRIFELERLYPAHCVVSAMHEYAAQFKPKWISVAKELPTVQDENYLVMVRNKNKEGGIPIIDMATWTEDGWNQWNTWETVQYWMPLPEPPTT